MSRTSYSLLILDDEPIFRKTLRLHLENEYSYIYEAQNLAEARQVLSASHCDFILCDWKLKKESGLTLLQELKQKQHQSANKNQAQNEIQPEPSIIFMSAHASEEVALKAIELGAQDFIVKPFEISELKFRLKRLLESKELQQRLVQLEKANETHALEHSFEGIIGHSSQMQSLFKLIKRVAQTSSKLLIQGESGTGKELVAQAVHRYGQSAKTPFVAVNCAAIPEALIESELFGHIKGSFTHAHSDRIGLIEEANGGTFFLDEIGELPLNLQSKLLRLLQEGEIRRVGSNHPIPIDVRFIAATHKNLEQEIQAQRFREDLYYRLNVIPITVPPLRERTEDIPILFDHFLRQMSLRLNKTLPQISAEVLQALIEYDWPGNVRELQNCAEYSLILSSNQLIEISDIPERISQKIILQKNSLQNLTKNGHLSPDPQDLSIKKNTQILEKNLILKALQLSKGVKTQAAKSLEISTKTLLYKLRDYNVDPDQFS